MRRILWILLALVPITIGGVLLYNTTQTPSNDRNWSEEQSRTPTADVSDSSVTLHDVSNWNYDASGPLTKEWVDVTENPKDIKRVWFILEPFSAWEVIGHTFLSFEFNDGTTLSFSVEARREKDEDYSGALGVLNKYELTYQWGTERDFITRRLFYYGHPLRLYELTLSDTDKQALFLSLVADTNTLSVKPRFYNTFTANCTDVLAQIVNFYNTFTANCTDVLAQIVNEHYPGTLPYDLSWNLPGLSEKYLIREGYITMDATNIEELRSQHELAPYKDTLLDAAKRTPEEFSATLHSLFSTSATD
jgi:hypothetical protein